MLFCISNPEFQDPGHWPLLQNTADTAKNQSINQSILTTDFQNDRALIHKKTEPL